MIVVVATEKEAELAKQKFPDAPIIKTGVGALNVINALKDIDRNEEILNFGHVGSNMLPIGTEVHIGESKLYHPHVSYEEPSYILMKGDTTCFTSNDFVLNTDIVDRPVVFDMELAYIMALGFNDVKSIKIVSDNLNLAEYNATINN